MKAGFISFLLVVCLALGVLPLSAQDMVIVPNLAGLNLPQAAAELNRVGLRLGNQSVSQWTIAAGFPPNTVGAQSVTAGSTAASGTAVDVTILRSANVALVYDDNDLTVINLTADPLNISQLTFAAVEGTSASFAAARWAGTLDTGGCGQIWSVSRTGPKDVEGCASTFWLTTNQAQEHFWTAVNGVARFSILDNGIERAVCAAAPARSQDQPVRCEAFVAAAEPASEVTPYIYFAYTTQAFAVINRSPDQWMLTAQTTILNYNPGLTMPGLPVVLGDPTLFGNPRIVADIAQLAPGQCLFLTSDNPNVDLPEPCDAIARLDLTSSVAFWLADFQIDGVTDDGEHQCPAAVPGKTTICIMPR